MRGVTAGLHSLTGGDIVTMTENTTGGAGIPIGKLAVIGGVVTSRITAGVIGRIPGGYRNGRFIG